MDSGASGGSMQSQSGCSGQDHQNATNSISNFYQHHHPNLHQFTSASSQHLQSPTLTYNHNNSNLFIDSVPRSDLDQIWSMNYANNYSQRPNEQQQMLHSSSSLTPSSAANNISQAKQDSQPSKLSSSSSKIGEEISGSSSGRVVKKRTRASRKTPTTVLTTDTTNFKSMVQEFTGIPTPPFGPSDPSLGSLLYSLNKSATTNNNPNPFDPPLITATSHNTFHQHQQQSQLWMLSGLNTPHTHNDKNPNRSFNPSSPRPPFPSTTSDMCNSRNKY